MCHNYWAQVLQTLKPKHPSAQAPQQEKPPQWEVCILQLENIPNSSQMHSTKDPAQKKKKKNRTKSD